MGANYDQVEGFDHTALSHEAADAAAEAKVIGMDLSAFVGEAALVRMVDGQDLVGELRRQNDGVITLEPEVEDDETAVFPRHLENDGSVITLTGADGRLTAGAVSAVRSCLVVKATSVKQKRTESKILWSLGGYVEAGAKLGEDGEWVPDSVLVRLAADWNYDRDAKKERVLKKVDDPAANLKKVQDDIRRREINRRLARNARKKNKTPERRISGSPAMLAMTNSHADSVR